MPDDDGDKTEDPTPKRRQEARQEGDVARSSDLAGSALLVAVLAAFYMVGGRMWEAMLNVGARSFGAELQDVPAAVAEGSGAAAQRWVSLATKDLAAGVLPVMGAVVVVAILANVAQVGFNLTPKKLQPNAKALNPISGFKKLFFESKTYVSFGMNLLKLGIVAAVAWWSVSASLPQILALQHVEPANLIGAAGMCVFGVGIKVALALLVLSLLDYAYQKWQHEQKLKMTKQQVKDEMKNMEGDPQMKARRRQVAMQQAMKGIRDGVPDADVVVTNPTHFAVAIKYDEAKMHAPRVVAKGGDLLAMRIREMASANGVPIVERPPLARALFRSVEVGGEIPEDFYSAVAELLAYVYRLDRELAGSAA